jgi:hypothetical protein
MSNLSAPPTQQAPNPTLNLAQNEIGNKITLTPDHLAQMGKGFAWALPGGMGEAALDLVKDPINLLPEAASSARSLAKTLKDLAMGNAPDVINEAKKQAKELYTLVIETLKHNPEIFLTNPLFAPFTLAYKLAKEGKFEEAGKQIGHEIGKHSVPLALTALGVGAAALAKYIKPIKVLLDMMQRASKARKALKDRATKAVNGARLDRKVLPVELLNKGADVNVKPGGFGKNPTPTSGKAVPPNSTILNIKKLEGGILKNDLPSVSPPPESGKRKRPAPSKNNDDGGAKRGKHYTGEKATKINPNNLGNNPPEREANRENN